MFETNLHFMFWEEKIDRLKSKFSQEHFRVPFSDWEEIFKNTEAKYIKKGWPVYHFCNWSENLKEKTHIRNISRQDIATEISKLDSTQNYWVFIVFADYPTSKQFVYDCNVDAMKMLLSIAPADFYIGHKKHEWLIYCKVNRSENSISINKTKVIKTPFD